MKNGIFSLFLAVLLSSAFAATPRTYGPPATQNDFPEGDIEKFFERIKAACAKPETAGNQLPPEHIMISCEENDTDWIPGKSARQTRTLNRAGNLDVAIFCDKDLGQLKESFGIAIPSLTAACPEFEQVKITKKMTVNTITCADVQEYASAQEFCGKVLEDAVPTTAPTGVVINLCGGGNGQSLGNALNYSVIH